VAAIGIAGGTALSGLFPKRARCRTGIPAKYAYGLPELSEAGTVELVEQRPVNTAAGESVANDDPQVLSQRRSVRFFHLADARPLVVPVVLTQVDFDFHSSGKWGLSLTAHHNPQSGNAAELISQSLAGAPNQFGRTKGSRCHVTIRCYARDLRNAGRRQLLASFTAAPFWVPGGRPRRVVLERADDDRRFRQRLKRFFHDIDLVECELRYETSS
jgi:hypothetical protein